MQALGRSPQNVPLELSKTQSVNITKHPPVIVTIKTHVFGKDASLFLVSIGEYRELSFRLL
jgi:hypothetical protein